MQLTYYVILPLNLIKLFEYIPCDVLHNHWTELSIGLYQTLFPRSGDVIHPQLWESGSGYETRWGGGGGPWPPPPPPRFLRLHVCAKVGPPLTRIDLLTRKTLPNRLIHGCEYRQGFSNDHFRSVK